MNRYYHELRAYLSALLIVMIASTASAKEYGHYDVNLLLQKETTSAGTRYSFDVGYLDRMLNDLSSHANNYPPKFDTPQEQQRAIHDVSALSGMLNLLLQEPTPNPEFLLRAAYINSMGHNLDIPEAAEKANRLFQQFLAQATSDPKGNFMYGTFLGNIGKSAEALPYLKKSLSLGVIDANWSLGLTYLMLGDKDNAIRHLEAYKRYRPENEGTDRLIDAIRNGKVQVKRSDGSAQ